MHAAGERLTYDTLRDRRGGGSKRDIARALRVWHARRAEALGEIAFDMPEDIKEEAGAFGVRLWSMVTDRVADRLLDLQVEMKLIEHHADEEIAYFHKIIGDQLTEIDELTAKITRLERERKRQSK